MGEISRTAALSARGVSIWLDDLSRSRIYCGEANALIEGRNVVGIVTNPVFARASRYVKIPAAAGAPIAVEEATARGISANVTPIFGLDRYRGVNSACLSGRERAHAAGNVTAELSALGISHDELAASREPDGIKKFAAAWSKLTATAAVAVAVAVTVATALRAHVAP